MFPITNYIIYVGIFCLRLHVLFKVLFCLFYQCVVSVFLLLHFLVSVLDNNACIHIFFKMFVFLKSFFSHIVVINIYV